MPSTDPWNGAIVSDCRKLVAWKKLDQKYKHALEERSATAHTRTYTDKHGRTKVEPPDRCYKILVRNIPAWVDSGFKQGPDFKLVSLAGWGCRSHAGVHRARHRPHALTRTAYPPP